MPRDHCGNFLGAQLGSKEEHPKISIVANFRGQDFLWGCGLYLDVIEPK